MDSDSTTPNPKRLCLETVSISSSDTLDTSTASEESEEGFMFTSEPEIEESSEEEFIFLPGKDSAAPFLNTSHSPVRACRQPSTSESFAALKTIGEVLVSNCCERLCVRYLTCNDVMTAQKNFSSLKNVVRQREWITDKVVDSSTATNSTIVVNYTIAGKNVCRQAFSRCQGFSQKRLFRIEKSVSKGQLQADEHGNRGKKWSSSRVQTATTWMSNYFNRIGDKQPDKDRIHLPSWDTKDNIYQRYKSDVSGPESPGVSVVGSSTFYRIWSEEFKHVLIPEVSSTDLSL